MPIAALSTNTVSAIGSCQVLTDSSSLVKELVENALDANASSITVEISLNVLDIIQVKDNGTGISPNDFEMACKRNCTSKITTLEDMRKIGGKTLGFRGQALASAADMSGNLRFTTKTDDGVIGKALEIGRRGEILSSENASHPTGTTIRIKDFMKNIPVRRQTALKSTQKTIAKIKKTLQAYAIARPQTRISIKVLRSPSDSGNWIYVPTPNAGMAEAAMKVVSRDVAGQCVAKSWPSINDSSITQLSQSQQSTSTVNGSQQEPVQYRIEALLPTPDSDFQNIQNKGQFISIDGRPVNSSRGTFKELVKMYKDYIRPHSDVSKPLSDPFLCMNIKCSPGSYDPNVEPSKDDVLFVDPRELLRVAEELFKCLYGEIDDLRPQTGLQKLTQSSTSMPNRRFDLLLARHPSKSTHSKNTPAPRDLEDENFMSSQPNPSKEVNSHTETESVVSQYSITSFMEPNDEKGAGQANSHYHQSSTLTGHRSMSSADDDEMLLVDEESESVLDEVGDDPAELRSAKFSNPWTMAKMNATIRPSPQKLVGDRDGNAQLPTPAREQQRTQAVRESQTSTTQRGSTLNPSIPSSPRSSQSSIQRSQLSPQEWFGPLKRPWHAASQSTSDGDTVNSAKAKYGAGALNTWIQKSTREQMSPTYMEAQHDTPTSSRQNSSSVNHQTIQDAQLEGASMPPTNTQGNPHRLSLPRKLGINSPFKFPLKQSNQNNPRPLTYIQRALPLPLDSNSPPPAQFTPVNPNPNPNTTTDLQTVMDFEYRKKVAQLQRKQFLAQEQRLHALGSPANSPDTISLNLRDDTEDMLSIPNSTRQFPASPHRNRYLAAKSALSSPFASHHEESFPPPVSQGGNSLQRPPLHPKDRRAYLMRRHNLLSPLSPQGAKAGGSKLKIRGAKTSLLPLEITPTGSETYNLSLNLETSIEGIAHLVKTAASVDTYVRSSNAKFPGLSGEVFAGTKKVEDWQWEEWGRNENGLTQVCRVKDAEKFLKSREQFGEVLRGDFVGLVGE